MEQVNEKGTIRINRNIFGMLVAEAVGLTDERAYAASDKGKILTGLGGGKPTTGEIADNIRIEERDGQIYLECYIVVNFGASIRNITGAMTEYLKGQLRSMFPGRSGKVKVKVVGVRSRFIAERDIEVEKEWT